MLSVLLEFHFISKDLHPALRHPSFQQEGTFGKNLLLLEGGVPLPKAKGRW
jgi:hypothetical protein